MPIQRPLKTKDHGKGGESDEKQETTSSRFQELTKGLLKVPLDKVKEAEKAEKAANKLRRESRPRKT